MATTATPIKKEQSNGLSAGNKKGIENHNKAAKHLEEAAKYHREAAKYHKDGNHEKASESTIKAYGHHYLASEAERQDVTYHALNS